MTSFLTPDGEPIDYVITPEGVTFRYMIITPEMAKEMLDANTRNRKYSPRTGQSYSRSMTNADWPFTADPLRFDCSGALIDGQHRLEAIVASGVSLPMVVVSDLPDEVQRYLDSGRSRTAADNLTLHGVTNSLPIAAMARLVLQWQDWRKGVATSNVPKQEVFRWVIDNRDSAAEALKVANEVNAGTRTAGGAGATRAATGAAYLRIMEVNPDAIFPVHAWFTTLASGEMLPLGHPLMTLRNALLRGENAGRSTVQLYQIIRTWNACQRGEGLKALMPPRGGITTASIGRMDAAPLARQEPLTELDEQAAKAVEDLPRRDGRKKRPA